MPESDLAFNLLSTSQTNPLLFQYVDTLTGEKGRAEKETKDPQLRCIYGAPMVALILAGHATIGQACCNHWDCPACGIKRAKQEYRRIVSGCETLAISHKMYFWTLTCRGRECSLEEAEENYYVWTNRLLTNARTKCKRENGYWAYVQVTERQQKTRQHPHSHIITTFLPSDARSTGDARQARKYVSAWMARANESAGLGAQHRISEVKSASAVSRYVAKYMFKDTLLTKWPPSWKRVRYSEGWPMLPSFTPDFVCVLRSPDDWHKVERQSVLFQCVSPVDYEIARHHIGLVLPPTGIDDIVDMSPITE